MNLPRGIRLAILGALALIPMALRIQDVLRLAKTPSPQFDYSGRGRSWQRSIDCGLRTGTFWTYCAEDGKIRRVEEIMPGDDKGYILLLTFLSDLRGRATTAHDIVVLNLVLNGAALLITSLACFLSGWPGLAAALLWLGPRFVIPGFLGPEIYAGFAGLFCLILTAGIMLSRLLEQDRAWGLKTAATYAAFVALIGFICLMRQPLGVVTVLFCSIFTALKSPRLLGSRRARLRLAVLAAAPVLAYLTPFGVAATRNLLFDTPRETRGIAAHGVGHALLLGLGTDANAFDIRYDDVYGEELIKRERPDIEFLSADYYRFAWKRYLGIVFHHPAQVLMIYAKKTGTALGNLTMDWIGLFVILLWTGRFALDRSLLREAGAHYSDPCLIFGMASSLALLQGIIVTPDPVYMYPSFMGFFFFQFCLAAAAFESRLGPIFWTTLLWLAVELCWGYYHTLSRLFGPDTVRWLEGLSLTAETALAVFSVFALSVRLQGGLSRKAGKRMAA